MIATDKYSIQTKECVFFLAASVWALLRQSTPDLVGMQVLPRVHLFSEPLSQLAKNRTFKLSTLMKA